MDHTFSQTTTPGEYRCTCGWQGSDYLAHRGQTMIAALRQARRQAVRIVHATTRDQGR